MSHSLYSRAGRARRRAATAAALATLALLARPASGQTLRGSPESVERAHAWAVSHGLTFEPSRTSALRGAAKGDYVPLRPGVAYRLKGVSMPYALPATAAWVDDMATQYRRACGEPMTVTSALRP